MFGRLFTAGAVLLAAVACGGSTDADRDGLDDQLESRLAVEHLPRLHEYAGAGTLDECREPRQRPIVYRARPMRIGQQVDVDAVVITYVLLYEKDCGALGHAGDSEAFMVFVRRDKTTNRWTTVGAAAIAHQGSQAQKVSTGAGTDIWISRNKHANFATFEDCGDSDIPGDVCTADSPPPAIYALLNAGEPGAHLSNDVGDVMIEAGPHRGRSTWRGAHADGESAHAYKLFRGRSIWDHESFLGAGSLTAQLELDTKLTAPPAGPATSGSLGKDDDQ